MYVRAFFAFIVAVSMTSASLTLAQTTQSTTEPAPGTSPLVNADGSVTFKLYAPNAKAVVVNGDFTFVDIPMKRDNLGDWTVTAGPLKPNMYSYNFDVDGLEIVDPGNTIPKVGVIWFSSQFVVPGAAADFFAVTDVPHGQLHEMWYQSPALHETRRVIVYTPPGYDATADKIYPVLYLLHGYGDNETGWTNGGLANFIMDNLLAAEKAKPMVIVMPFGHPSRQWVISRGRPKAGSPTTRNTEAFAADTMETELLTSVIPLVQKSYRVRTDRANRAIAGLSMGGQQALMIGTKEMADFAYVAGFSAALLGDNATAFAPFLAKPDDANSQLKLLWFGIGDKDALITGDQQLDQLLSEHGIKHQFVVTAGYGHAWTLWRGYLRDLLPRLFQ